MTPVPPQAKLYGPILRSAGFAEVSLDDYEPKAGDVIVLQNYLGRHPAGHIAMFSDSQGIPDFRQRDKWAGPGYRRHRPHVAIFRP